MNGTSAVVSTTGAIANPHAERKNGANFVSCYSTC